MNVGGLTLKFKYEPKDFLSQIKDIRDMVKEVRGDLEKAREEQDEMISKGLPTTAKPTGIGPFIVTPSDIPHVSTGAIAPEFGQKMLTFFEQKGGVAMGSAFGKVLQSASRHITQELTSEEYKDVPFEEVESPWGVIARNLWNVMQTYKTTGAIQKWGKLAFRGKETQLPMTIAEISGIEPPLFEEEDVEKYLPESTFEVAGAIGRGRSRKLARAKFDVAAKVAGEEFPSLIERRFVKDPSGAYEFLGHLRKKADILARAGKTPEGQQMIRLHSRTLGLEDLPEKLPTTPKEAIEAYNLRGLVFPYGNILPETIRGIFEKTEFSKRIHIGPRHVATSYLSLLGEGEVTKEDLQEILDKEDRILDKLEGGTMGRRSNSIVPEEEVFD